MTFTTTYAYSYGAFVYFEFTALYTNPNFLGDAIGLDAEAAWI